jgi:hypothetical protein
MLTMNINHAFTQVSQNLGRDGTAVNVSTGTTVLVDHTSQHELTILVNPLFFKDIVDNLILIDLKNSGDFRTVTLTANNAAVCPVTQNQSQSINNDRFACAGFTGKYCHACIELDLELFNDSKITYVQMFQQLT